MVGNLVPSGGGAINQVDPARIAIGARVEVLFDDVGGGVILPRWTLV